jgi:hypothetical protein
MNRLRFRFVDIIYIVAIIMADLFVYVVLGLFFMGYDDNYNASKGAYLSLQSMTTADKVVYFAINLWHVVNIVFIIWTIYKIYKWFKLRRLTQNATQEKYGT